MKKTSRIAWIDICKILGIILVVLGHVGVTKSQDIWIHAFHMPIFFLLSGLCFNEKKHLSIGKFVKSRFKTLIIPYLIFGILLYFLWIGVSSLKFGNLFKCMVFPASTNNCYGTINWFLPSLFIVEVVFILVSKLTKSSPIIISIIAVVMSIIGFYYPVITQYRLPLALDTAIMGFAFYSFGWILRRINFEKVKIILSKHQILYLISAILLLILSIPFTKLNQMTNLRTLTYGSYYLYIFSAIAISILVIIISILLDICSKKFKIINGLIIGGRHTLVILLLNSFLARLYLLLIDGKVIIENKYLVTLNNCIVAVIIVIICVLLAKFINKYMPIIIGKNKTNE